MITGKKLDALLQLYREISSGEATAETFEKAIKEQGLTMEIIEMVKKYYNDEVE